MDLEQPLEQSIAALFEPPARSGAASAQAELPLEDDGATIKVSPISMHEAVRKNPLPVERRSPPVERTTPSKPAAAPPPPPAARPSPPPSRSKVLPMILGAIGLAIVAGTAALYLTGDPQGVERPTPTAAPTADVTPSPTATEAATPTTGEPPVEPTSTPTIDASDPTPTATPSPAPSPSPTATPSPSPGTPARAARRITRIERAASGDALTLRVQGDGSLKFNAFNLDDPPRFVVDFPGMTSDDRRTSIDAGSPGVSRIRLGHDGDKVRIVLDLNGAARASATEVGGVIEIRVEP